MPTEAGLAASRWRLCVPRRRLAGRIGDRVGRGLGASIEFEDHRPYQPGDDPRHVDWRAYARTDRVEVRLYREEVAPVLDVLIDTSASMGTTDAKVGTLRDLCEAAPIWSGVDGGTMRMFEAGGGRLDPARPIRPSGPQRALAPSEPLRSNGLRLVVSDFLFPHDPLVELARISAGGAHTFVVQLLDTAELSPEPAGTVTLVDVEDGSRVDLALDPRAIEAYRERLARLDEELADAVRTIGGTLGRARAGSPAGVFAELARQGVLEPA